MPCKRIIVGLAVFISIIFLFVCCTTSQKTNQTKKIKTFSHKNLTIIDKYRMNCAYAVHNNWIAPERTELASGKIYTSLTFKIMPNGSIKDIIIVDESGDKDLDDSAIDAVKRSDPFEQHPEELSKPYVNMGLRFSPYGIR